MSNACVLCNEAGGRVVFSSPKFRVIHAVEPGLDAFYRVIWMAHVAEWSDLSEADQSLCMQAVTAVERSLRDVLKPHKINIASLGNMVPHLHWHVIARYEWDGYFPAPVWGTAHTPPEQLPQAHVEQIRAHRVDLEAAMVARLSGLCALQAAG